jgi:CheY-like chemotaxis protein
MSEAPLRIVLVDDEAPARRRLRELLDDCAGALPLLVVGEAASGREALHLLGTTPADLVLTDIHMPDMDGIEATKAIRLHETQTGGQRTPIVALTADALETGKWACKDAGMDGFLTKPIDPAQLDKMFIAIFPSIEPALSAAE